MRGHLNEAPVRPGVWRAVIDLPRGEDNKRRQRTVTIYAAGRREAESKLAKLVADANAGKIATRTKETVESYVSAWLKKREGDGLSPKTLETWRDFSRAYIFPHIGKVPLEKLTPRQVDDLYSTLRASGRRRGEGGLSPRTVLHVHRLLSEAMKSAVRLEVIHRNPCETVGPKGVKLSPRSHVERFDLDALRKLYAAVEGTWLYVPVILATGLGMRRGECLGLTWEAVDLKAGRLDVEKTLQQLRGSDPSLKKPKGEKGRSASMPAFVADALRKHKGAQAEHKLRAVGAWNEQGFVVTDALGNPRTPNALSLAFAAAMQRLAEQDGLPVLTFHDLRHVAATAQLMQGVPLKVVSRRLGHATTAITADLYQHVLQEMDDDAAQKTDDYFRQALGA